MPPVPKIRVRTSPFALLVLQFFDQSCFDVITRQRTTWGLENRAPVSGSVPPSWNIFRRPVAMSRWVSGTLIVGANSSLGWNAKITIRKRRNGCPLSTGNFRTCTTPIVTDWKQSLPKFQNEPLPSRLMALSFTWRASDQHGSYCGKGPLPWMEHHGRI
jgi:hypothetical protein